MLTLYRGSLSPNLSTTWFLLIVISSGVLRHKPCISRARVHFNFHMAYFWIRNTRHGKMGFNIWDWSGDPVYIRDFPPKDEQVYSNRPIETNRTNRPLFLL